MPYFRKKPVVIEAVRLDKSSSAAELLALLEGTRWRPDTDGLYITTLEGEMKVGWGDWIIQGVAGEVYPCKPDIFAMTYEPEE